MSFFKGWGEYPPEYNREIHGPYNPGVYYGKRDTPLADVKLGELMSWLSRRNKSPRAMVQAINRAWFRYQTNWIFPKRPGPTFFFHGIALYSLLNYLIDYKRFTSEAFYRYH